MRKALLTALLVAFWPAPMSAQLPNNIPFLCTGSPDNVPVFQTVTLSGNVDKSCIEVAGVLRLADGLNLSTVTIQELPGGRVETVSPQADNIRITIKDVAPTDPEQYGTGVLLMGAYNLTGKPTATWTRLTAELAAGATSVQVESSAGMAVGGELGFGETRQYTDGQMSLQAVTITAINGNTVSFTPANQVVRRAARNADGSIAWFPEVSYLSRGVTIQSANPNGSRGHVIVTGNATGLIDGVAFVNMGRTRNDLTAAGSQQFGRYACHFHHNPNAGELRNSVVRGALKWGCSVHQSTNKVLNRNVIFGAEGWGIGTEDGMNESNVTFANNLIQGVTGDGNRGDRGRGEWATNPLMKGTAGVGVWLAKPDVNVTGNVVQGSQIAGYMIWGDRQAALAQFDSDTAWASPSGLTMWDVNGGTVSNFSEAHNRSGMFNYATANIAYQNWTGRGDPQNRSTETLGLEWGDYSTIGNVVAEADIQNKQVGILVPWAIADYWPGTETTPRVFEIRDSVFCNNDSDVRLRTLGGSSGIVKPLHTTNARRNVHCSGGPTHYANVGPIQAGDSVPVFNVIDYQGVTGDTFRVYSADNFPAGAVTRAKILDRVVGGSTPPPDPDSDGDGIKDSLDKCPNTPAGTIVDLNGCPVNITPAATITLNPAVRFQTFQGWEGSIEASISDYDLVVNSGLLPHILDMAVNDLGLNRARLSIRNGIEGGGNDFVPDNDNADPNVLDLSRFDFAALDFEVDKFITPLKALSAARGETFYVNIRYVDHEPNTPFEHAGAEYAEFMLAVFTHLQQRYGWVPQGIDIINEPDNFADWNPTRIGQAIVATAQKLQAAGFAVPDFTMPTTVNTSNAVSWFDQVMAVPGVAGLVKEIGYHRYGVSVSDLQALAQRAQQFSLRVYQGEYWGDFSTPNSGANYQHLYQDLTLANVTAWQQGVFVDFNLCVSQYLRRSNGGELCPNTFLTRQYTKYIRPGAVRIQASAAAPYSPVAFVNTNGGYVVVVMTDSGSGQFTVGGLPAGTYGVFRTAAANQVTTDDPDVTIAAGQNLTATMPDVGVITIYAKTGGPPPPTDSDGDGVPDSMDQCPTQPGPASNNGCPVPPPTDTDGDGVPDSQDQCPTVAGPASNNGCPIPPPADTDGDGVTDDVDKCPTQPGPASNAGCPLPPPTDVCVTDPLRITRVSWPTSNTGRRSVTFDVGNKFWVKFEFVWPGILTVTDTRGCMATVRR